MAEGDVSWLRFALAATTVIGLMGLLGWGLKYIAARGWIVARPSAKRRLKLIETLPLDARRRLVLVQCDDREHLLLLGMGQDVVVAKDVKAPCERSDDSVVS